MSRTNFDMLLQAGCHFGHLHRKWNPAMAPYIYTERNGIHIIDLHKTVAKIDEAAEALKQIARSGKKILFVATKKQIKDIVAEKASAVNMPYVIERWPGGMLTNFPTIRKAVKKMANIDKLMNDGTYANLSKRELLQISRQRAKLEKNLGSIADLTRLPSAVFVVDVLKEAIAVKRMFDLTDRYGYGGRKISTVLKSEGIVNLRTGEPFHYSTIQHILSNIMNVGILRSGETQSEVFPDLQIIPLEQFQRVAKARKQRSINYAIQCGWEPETVTLADGSEATVVRSSGAYPRRIVGKALLSGNVYCGHCGGRIFATTARKNHYPTQNPERIAVYKCYNRTQHKEQCDGPSTYRAEKVDRVVESVLHGIFERAKQVNEDTFLKHQVQASTKHYQEKLTIMKAEYTKATKELSKWEDMMLDSMEGNCVFTSEQIKKRMDTVQERIVRLIQDIESIQSSYGEAKSIAEEIAMQHQNLLSWAQIFDAASIPEKKVIASQIIKAVTLTRNYGIQIEFRISEAQFLNGMDMS